MVIYYWILSQWSRSQPVFFICFILRANSQYLVHTSIHPHLDCFQSLLLWMMLLEAFVSFLHFTVYNPTSCYGHLFLLHPCPHSFYPSFDFTLSFILKTSYFWVVQDLEVQCSYPVQKRRKRSGAGGKLNQGWVDVCAFAVVGMIEHVESQAPGAAELRVTAYASSVSSHVPNRIMLSFSFLSWHDFFIDSLEVL